jgi:tetratricopeptide (TPR) repeat protein
MADQELCAVAPPVTPADDLRFVTVSRMRGDWSSGRFALTRKGLNAHLALSPDALWVGYRGELRRYPIAALAECQRDEQGKELRLRFRKADREVAQGFFFPNWDDCQQWHEQLLRLMGAAAGATEQGPGVVPVIFLRGAPNLSYQPLGEVESQEADGDRAAVELQVRAAVKGADAVADLREDPALGPDRPLPRRWATAIRAADADGRRELRARWCAGRVSRIGGIMLLLVGLSFVVTLLNGTFFLWYSRTGRALPPAPGGPIAPLLLDMAGLIALIHLGPLVLVGLTRGLGWPGLLRPAGVVMLLLGLKPVAVLLGALAAGVVQGRWNSSFFTIVTLADPVNLVILVCCWNVCRDAWRLDRQCREVVPDAASTAPAAQRGVAAAGVAFGVLACAFLGWGQYALASAYGLPGSDAWKEHHALTAFQDGMTSGVGDLAGAEKAFRRSSALWQELAGAAATPEHQHNLAATYTNLGTVLLFQGRFAEGLESLRRGLRSYEQIGSDFPEYQSHRGGLRFARSNLAEMERDVPGFEDAQEGQEGQRLERLGQYAEVVAYFREALARCEAGKKDLEPRAYRRLLAMKQNRLAWALATSEDPGQRDPKEAVGLARKAVENSPSDAAIWNTLGAAYYRAGLWEECKKAIGKSLELGQWSEGPDWLILAMANHQMGQRAEARRWLDQAAEWIARLEAKKYRHPQEHFAWVTQRRDCLRLRDEANQLIRGKDHEPK